MNLKDAAKAGDPIAMHDKRIEVTLVDLGDLRNEPVLLYRRVSWWRKFWRRLVR